MSISYRAFVVPALATLGLAIGSVVPGCGDEDGDAGHECHDHHECEDYCAKGKDFPWGICTYQCHHDEDCPGGWVCIDKDGGICLELCHDDHECSDLYGDRDWKCRDKKREEGGHDDVCLGK